MTQGLRGNLMEAALIFSMKKLAPKLAAGLVKVTGRITSMITRSDSRWIVQAKQVIDGAFDEAIDVTPEWVMRAFQNHLPTIVDYAGWLAGSPIYVGKDQIQNPEIRQIVNTTIDLFFKELVKEAATGLNKEVLRRAARTASADAAAAVQSSDTDVLINFDEDTVSTDTPDDPASTGNTLRDDIMTTLHHELAGLSRGNGDRRLTAWVMSHVTRHTKTFGDIVYSLYEVALNSAILTAGLIAASAICFTTAVWNMSEAPHTGFMIGSWVSMMLAGGVVWLAHFVLTAILAVVRNVFEPVFKSLDISIEMVLNLADLKDSVGADRIAAIFVPERIEELKTRVLERIAMQVFFISTFVVMWMFAVSHAVDTQVALIGLSILTGLEIMRRSHMVDFEIPRSKKDAEAVIKSLKVMAIIHVAAWPIFFIVVRLIDSHYGLDFSSQFKELTAWVATDPATYSTSVTEQLTLIESPFQRLVWFLTLWALYISVYGALGYTALQFSFGVGVKREDYGTAAEYYFQRWFTAPIGKVGLTAIVVWAIGWARADYLPNPDSAPAPRIHAVPIGRGDGPIASDAGSGNSGYCPIQGRGASAETCNLDGAEELTWYCEPCK